MIRRVNSEPIDRKIPLSDENYLKKCMKNSSALNGDAKISYKFNRSQTKTTLADQFQKLSLQPKIHPQLNLNLNQKFGRQKFLSDRNFCSKKEEKTDFIHCLKQSTQESRNLEKNMGSRKNHSMKEGSKKIYKSDQFKTPKQTFPLLKKPLKLQVNNVQKVKKNDFKIKEPSQTDPCKTDFLIQENQLLNSRNLILQEQNQQLESELQVLREKLQTIQAEQHPKNSRASEKPFHQSQSQKIENNQNEIENFKEQLWDQEQINEFLKKELLKFQQGEKCCCSAQTNKKTKNQSEKRNPNVSIVLDEPCSENYVRQPFEMKDDNRTRVGNDNFAQLAQLESL